MELLAIHRGPSWISVLRCPNREAASYGINIWGTGAPQTEAELPGLGLGGEVDHTQPDLCASCASCESAGSERHDCRW